MQGGYNIFTLLVVCGVSVSCFMPAVLVSSPNFDYDRATRVSH